MASRDPQLTIRATDKTRAAFKSVDSNLAGFKKQIGGAMGAIAGLVGVAGIGALIKSQIEAADEIGKLSTRLGISTEALSQYRHVAKLSGVDFRTLTIGMQRMTRRVSEAAIGTGEARDALRELNLSAADLTRLAPDQQFEKIADAINSVKNPADKVRLAMKMFDSEGVALLQTMSSGAAGIREMRQELDDLGGTLSQETVNDAAEARDALARLQQVGSTLGLVMAKELGPVLADVANWLSINIPTAAAAAAEAFESLVLAIADVEEGAIRPVDTLGKKIIELERDIQGKRAAIANAPGLAARFAPEMKALEKQLADYLALQEAAIKRQAEFNEKFKPKAPESFETSADFGAKEVGTAGASEAEQAREAATRRRLATSVEALTVSLMTEEERLFNSYANRQLIVEEALDSDLITQQRHQELLLELAAQFEADQTKLVQKGYTDRQRFAEMSTTSQTKHVVGQAIEITRGVTGESKKLFKINQLAGIVNATINTYEGVTKALAAYPPPYNFGMAALVLSAGLAQVSAIKSASFGGGGGGGGSLAGGSTPPTPPSDFATPVPDRFGGQEIKITIDGTGVLTRDQADTIATSLREYIADGGEGF